VVCCSILTYYSDLRSSEPKIMLICGDLRFLGRPPAQANDVIDINGIGESVEIWEPFSRLLGGNKKQL